jgi:tetratricopeptide (TPR) repeat protein
MLCYVRYVGLVSRMGEEGEMKMARQRRRPFAPGSFSLTGLIALAFFVTLAAAPGDATAASLQLPSEAQQAIEKMYGGDPDGAIELLHSYEAAHQDEPLPFTIEAEARWWKIYCDAAEIKWGLFDSQKRGKRPEDESYFALADRVIRLAQAQIAQHDTSENHLYAGIGYALKTRLYGLRSENRNAAHTGVAARTEFLRALDLDPNNADASVGIGLYNYYVETLPSIVKVLRFFMGIPGGNKEEGLRQIRVGIEHGVLLSVDARFYLARNLRTYEQQYQQALDVAEPLVTRYPQNPIFLLLVGNLNLQLGRRDKAAEYFNAVLKLPAVALAADCCTGCVGCNGCPAHVRNLAQEFLNSIH